MAIVLIILFVLLAARVFCGFESKLWVSGGILLRNYMVGEILNWSSAALLRILPSIL